MKSLLQAIAAVMIIAPVVLQGAYASDARPITDKQDPPAFVNTSRSASAYDDSDYTSVARGHSDADLAISRSISRQICRSVGHRDALSISASKVTIITRDGVVTLVGSVRSVDEKESIAVISAASAGVKRVNNQLVVEAQR